jgi:hypothetical protein
LKVVHFKSCLGNRHFKQDFRGIPQTFPASAKCTPFLSEKRKGRAQVDSMRELYSKWPEEVGLEELNWIMLAQAMFNSRPVAFRTS